MRIDRWTADEGAAIRGCKEAWDRAQDIEDPDGPRMPERMLAAWFGLGFTGDPAQAWFAPGAEPGSVLGWYRLELTDLENTDRAMLTLVVHPAHRRQGLGGSLLRHAARLAAADGRSLLWGETRDGSPGEAFATAVGAKQGIAAGVRRLDLRTLPAGKTGSLRGSAAAAADGYSLLRWTGATPEEYRAPFARVLNAFNDAPHDEGVEEESWDAERVRERNDAPVRSMGLRRYTIAARHDASGELAAMSELSVDPDDPQWGHQGLTAVTSQHRGHRLGLLVKTAMLEWLAETEPQVERVQTGNALSNTHMIAVNQAIGFELVLPAWHNIELETARAAEA
ncbi:GNAT family N-acetyltransferase [Trebonia kvetii]|uniref:GNAT family N-acetyltransferase n=1 Tax=Trebonia kvetii TaxID=2480626 RepID=A0A6P2BR81_9ACTN|nr:GNAT family N-acetyltransferase [Trebonia kvetii]TVZ01378.1 GNAT family N-acetyltransferase [Trebonia kvetii]